MDKITKAEAIEKYGLPRSIYDPTVKKWKRILTEDGMVDKRELLKFLNELAGKEALLSTAKETIKRYRKLYPPREAAEILGICKSRLYDFSFGEIVAHRIIERARQHERVSNTKEDT